MKTCEDWLQDATAHATASVKHMSDKFRTDESYLKTVKILWLAERCEALCEIIEGLKVARDGSRQHDELYARYDKIIRVTHDY